MVFKHKDPGGELTQAEFIAACGDGHIFACQATGDIVYASSATVLSKLARGAANTVLSMGGSCIPAWTATPSLSSLTVDDVVVDGKVVTMTGSACDTIVMTAAANGAFSLVTTDTAAAAANITITADGTVEIDSTGTLTLDASTDIVLDADGDNITFKAGSGDSTGLDFSNSSGTWTIKPGTADADLIFNVNDGCVDTKVMAIDGGDSVVTFGGNSVKSGEIRILEDTDSGANYTAIKVGNMAANVTYTLPTNVAASCGLFLKSTCAGVLSWAAAGGGLNSCADAIISNGYGIVIGHCAQLTGATHPNNDTGEMQIIGTAGNDSQIAFINHSTSAGTYGKIQFARSRNTTVGSHTILQDGDVLGGFHWFGCDGNDFQNYGAKLVVKVDGSPGNNSMPGKMEFYTATEAACGNTLAMTIDHDGIITTPKQPAFLETIATTIANETGDGTAYVVVWDNEVFDQNADFSTSTFTAPVTGRYRLSLVISLSGIGSGQVDARVLLTATNRVVQHHWHGYNVRNGTSGTSGTSITTLMDMDASDTVTVTALSGPSGQSKDVDVEGTGGSNAYSFFSGELVA